MSVIVTRDNVPVSPILKDENVAFAWLLRHQSMSIDWAIKYEGYAIVEYVKPMDASIAYHRLTRLLTNMHASERDLLDERPGIVALVTGELEGDHKAVVAALALRTHSGDAWRQKQGIPFVK